LFIDGSFFEYYLLEIAVNILSPDECTQKNPPTLYFNNQETKYEGKKYIKLSLGLIT
jgi:hypothetical protein